MTRRYEDVRMPSDRSDRTDMAAMRRSLDKQASEKAVAELSARLRFVSIGWHDQFHGSQWTFDNCLTQVCRETREVLDAAKP